MADVKREQELAEKRKNDPQLDLAQDHLVRKIFSKFRKPSDGVPSLGLPSRPGSSAPNSSDVEKGPSDIKPKPAFSEPESRVGSALKASKWASALSSKTTQHREENPEPDHHMGYIDKQASDREDQNLGAVRRTELVCKKSEHIHVVKDIRPPTQGNKWPRVTTSGSVRHETIDESGEDEQKKPGHDTADSNKVLIQPKSINSVDYQQIVATLVDMRIDLKLEIQKLTNKMGKIDEHVTNITKKLASMNIAVDEQTPPVASVAKLSGFLRNSNKPLATLSKTTTIEEVDEEALATPTSTVPPKRIDSAPGGKIKDPKVPVETKVSSHRASSSHHRSSSGHKPTSQSNMRKPTKSKTVPGDDEGQKPTEPIDEMRAILENEIAEQDTDDDQDLTSKL